MKLHVIFGQRVCDYEGQHAPEVLDCWDEFSRDENPDGWSKALQQALERTRGDRPEFSSVVAVDVTFDGRKVYRLLNETPVIEAKVD